MAPNLSITLGPFELQAIVGRGGMGEVWRGRFTNGDLPVAVKVITAVQARAPAYRAAFRNEVRAVAGLDHGGIIMVLDHGQVDVAAEAASNGRLRAGSPYFVMELLNGGRLDALPLPKGWPELRALLRQLLAALGHAHARGVIHRDLKLGNVLLAGPSDLRPGYRLIDFGLARIASREGDVLHELAAGTPTFEAPEQILGRFRDHGPWTDLYALGCMAYALACGRPPFDGADMQQIHRCHLMVPMPSLENRIPLPVGFDDWLERLLAKHPSDRFQSAADADCGLASLSDAAPTKPRSSRGQASSVGCTEERACLSEAVTRPVPTTPVQQRFAQDRAGWLGFQRHRPADAMAVRMPPLPADWRSLNPDSKLGRARLHGAGMVFYGLRPVPLADREAERDRLWAALREVRREGRARLVLLRGAAGTGKSRLVEWLSARAHETAGIVALRADHSRIEGPADGLARMVARHLACVGLSRDQVLERVEARLREQGLNDPYEWHALTELIHPATQADRQAGVRPVTFRRPTERYVLIRRLLERLAATRPVIVWLDDAQWGFDALVFAKSLLQSQARTRSPILLAVTVQNESLSEAAQASDRVDELLRSYGAQAIDVVPLSAAARLQLVRALLGLEGELALRLARRTGGNPLFAIQLLGDWVERGALEASQHGFALRDGEAGHLPDSLHDVWKARIGRLLESHPDSARRTLEIAAALGRDVDTEELAETVAKAGAQPDNHLVEELIRARLARTTAGGWCFVHGMLRESIEREAREGGRWSEINRCCAAMLESRYDPSVPGTADRLGRHWVAAGALGRALEPLLAGAREHHDRSEFHTALSLLAERETTLDRLAVRQDDPARLDGWILRARIHLLQGQVDDAHSLSRRAEDVARIRGLGGALAESLLALAYGSQQQGDLATAEQLYGEAQVQFGRLGDTGGVADCLHGLGDLAQLRGANEHAASLTKEAMDLFERVDDAIGVARCLRGLGLIDQHGGQFDRAIARYELALERYRALGNAYGMAVCVNDLAEVARWRGCHQEAEAGYRQALAIYETIGSRDRVIAQLNLGMVLLARGRYEEARGQLRAGAEVCEQLGRLGLLAGVHAALLPCAAHAADWDACNHHRDRTEHLLSSTSLVSADIAWPAELAGDLARDGGRTDLAEAAYELALSQYEALGNGTASAVVRERLAELRPL